MRKIIVSAFVITIIIGLAVPDMLRSDNEARGIVVKVSGRPELVRGGKTSALKIKDFLMTGDTIKTSATSSVSIMLKKGVMVNVGAQGKPTTVTIDSLVHREDGADVRLNLTQGNLANQIKPETGNYSYEVKTPTSVASVRGTEFVMDTEEESSSLFVNSGAVNFSDPISGDSSVVKEGFKAVADTEGIKTAILEEFEKQKMAIFDTLDSIDTEQFEKALDSMREELDSQKNAIMEYKESILKDDE